MSAAIMAEQNRIGKLLNGRSIYWLAKQTGVTYKVIHRIVKSDQIPARTSYQTLKGIAEALDVKIDDLETDA